ncbi:unnamed protein product [Closterium sp. Yama58-4]|nr:unnamed protein product [Closterium sp. Yama58-4]
MCSNFFRTLYSGSNQVTPNPSFWQHIPSSSIPNPLFLQLSAPLSLSEIGKALLSLSRGKTPGPDGLPGELFRQFSPRFAPAFHSLLSPPQPLSCLPPSMLTGRTVLIPKRGDSSLVENLRLITLMNADYKVLALCLANRLQLVLPQLIHPSQTAFIKHRKIGDTINDTLDIMDWATYSSAPLLALTVDFRKAYDLVDRPFLLHALSVLGLPTSFIHWVRLMHSNTCTRISVNNMLGPTFPVRTGVRQGCPLAPLLFVCVMEIFHRYTSLFLPGFALSHAQLRLMACYADDVTLFLTSDTELGLAVVLLGVFGSVSGEIPNWSKCSIIPFNIPPTDLVHAGSIPIRAPNEAERILGIYVERLHPGSTTWNKALARIQSTAKCLAALHATVTCRKSLSSIFLNSVISFPRRFQPAPSDTIKRLDVSVGNFLSSSKHKLDGLAQRLISKALLYNSLQDGGVGAIAPSIQVKALAIQRALRRFGPTPSEEVARTLTPFPFGLHGLLSHKAILERDWLPTFIPPRALDELKALLSLPLVIHKPPLRMQCILTKPIAFNRFLLRPDERPFGTRQHERFLLTRQLRIGHLVRITNFDVSPVSADEFCSQILEEFHEDATRILPDLIKAIKPPWWAALRTPHASYASPGEWFMLSDDHYSISHLALQVVAYIPPASVSATVHSVSPNRRIARNPTNTGLFRLQDLIEVHVRDWWLAGPLHTGAGLGARIGLLQDGTPSIADIRRLLYSAQPLTHHSRWTRDLTLPPPPLPGLKDAFLKDQPSRQRDILFRLFTLTLPSGSRFQYFDDRGVCPRCPAAVVETLPHIFFECSSAGNVISALRTVADCHLGQTTTAEHIFFPIQSRVGQSPPWSLLVGAAVKTLWNARCDHKYRNSSSSSFEILQLVLAQFLIAFKIYIWRSRRQSTKKRQRTSSSIKRAQKLRFLLFDRSGTPSIHPDLRASWLMGNPFRPP